MMGFCGSGGTIVLTWIFLGAQMTTVGTGISTLMAGGLGRSGWSSVCAPGGAWMTMRMAAGGAGALPSARA
jgi:hypothetical protein